METKTYTDKINQYMNLKIKETRKYEFYDNISDEEIIENEWNMLTEIVTKWRLKYEKIYPHDKIDYEDLEQEAWILLLNSINTTRPDDHTIFNPAYFELIHNKYEDNNNYISCEDMSDLFDNKLGAYYTIDSIVEHHDMSDILSKFMDILLTTRERRLIERCYGISKYKYSQETPQQIAHDECITHKRLNQISKRARYKLLFKKTYINNFKAQSLSKFMEEYY